MKKVYLVFEESTESDGWAFPILKYVCATSKLAESKADGLLCKVRFGSIEDAYHPDNDKNTGGYIIVEQEVEQE